MKHSFTLLTFVMMFSLMTVNGQNRYSVNLAEAGTLRQQVLDLGADRIEALTISGPVNGVDLAYLNSATGIIAGITTLDLSGVTLAADETEYATITDAPEAGMGTTYVYTYYLSDNPRDESGQNSPTVIRRKCFRNDLSALFSENEKLTEVKWPATVASVGEYAFNKCKNLTSVSLPANIIKVGKSAFNYCANLHSLTLPSTVSEVGDMAFYHSGLGAALDFDDIETVGNSAFAGTAVTEVALGGRLRYLGSSAFSGCRKLKKITLTASIDSIAKRTFYQCEVLKTVVLPEELKYIGVEAFGMCNVSDISLPPTIEEIGGDAFSYCPFVGNIPLEDGIRYIGHAAYEAQLSAGTTSVTIKDGTISLTDGLFKYSTLTRAHLPASLRVIGANCFAGSNLSEITFPGSLERIGVSAFQDCRNLASVTIPENVKSVGQGAFSSCTQLWRIIYNAIDATCDQMMLSQTGGVERIELGQDIKRIPSGLFFGNTNITDVELPSTVELIDDQAFSGCTSLSAITIGDNVRKIGKMAFCDCAFTDFHWPLQLEEIGEQAFRNCPLRLVSLPEGFKTLGESAFYNCKSIESIYLPSTIETVKLLGDDIDFSEKATLIICALTEPPTWGVNLHYQNVNAGTVSIKVPAGSVEAYKSAPAWSEYARFITAIGEIDPVTETITTTFADGLDEDTDLVGTVVENIYITLDDNDTYDSRDGSIVVNSTMTMSQMMSVAGLNPGKSDLCNRFSGLVMELGTGEGTLTVDCRTVGSRKIGVMIGDAEPGFYTQDERGTITVEYSVSEPTFVYVCGCTEDTGKARSLRAATPADHCVRLYSIGIDHTPTSISDAVEKDATTLEITDYYTIDGLKIEQPALPGIYIIRYSDGSTRKVMLRGNAQ